MVTPPSTVRVPSESSVTPPSWRAVALWLAFAATLVTGIVLAIQFGGSVPVMLEELR